MHKPQGWGTRHQYNQQRKNWDELAGRLAGTGIDVLTLDYRGY